jgi:hypothetical protein
VVTVLLDELMARLVAIQYLVLLQQLAAVTARVTVEIMLVALEVLAVVVRQTLVLLEAQVIRQVHLQAKVVMVAHLLVVLVPTAVAEVAGQVQSALLVLLGLGVLAALGRHQLFLAYLSHMLVVEAAAAKLLPLQAVLAEQEADRQELLTALVP